MLLTEAFSRGWKSLGKFQAGSDLANETNLLVCTLYLTASGQSMVTENFLNVFHNELFHGEKVCSFIVELIV